MNVPLAPKATKCGNQMLEDSREREKLAASSSKTFPVWYATPFAESPIECRNVQLGSRNCSCYSRRLLLCSAWDTSCEWHYRSMLDRWPCRVTLVEKKACFFKVLMLSLCHEIFVLGCKVDLVRNVTLSRCRIWGHKVYLTRDVTLSLFKKLVQRSTLL